MLVGAVGYVRTRSLFREAGERITPLPDPLCDEADCESPTAPVFKGVLCSEGLVDAEHESLRYGEVFCRWRRDRWIDP